MEIYFLFLSIIITISTLFIHYKINSFLDSYKHINTLQNADEHANPTFNKSELTTYELERLEREEAFDERIARLQEEVNVFSDVVRKGVQAEELHPLVHNLPHNSVETRYDLTSYTEVAE